MKHKILSLVLLGLACSIGNVWGDVASPYTITFDNGTNKTNTNALIGGSVTVNGATWSLSLTGSNSDKASAASNGLKLGDSSNSDIAAEFTSSSFASYSITNVMVTWKNNTKANSGDQMATTVTVKVGNVNLADAYENRNNSSACSHEFSNATGLTGDLSIKFEQTGEYINPYYVQSISVTFEEVAPAVDEIAPTFSLATPATTTNVAISSRSVVLTASEAVTKVGDNVSGTLKIGTADATAINYTFDGTKNTLTYTFAEDLAYSTTYAFTVDAEQVQDMAENKNDATSAFSFTTEADIPAALTSVSPDGGSVNGNSTITVIAAGTVKYLWSAYSTASKGDSGWEEGTSISVPNEAGTHYLHLYVFKRADNQTDIVTKTFTITKIASTVIKEWDFTQSLSADDVANLTADESWSYTESSKRWTGGDTKLADKGNYITLQANGENLDVVNGLLLGRSGSNLQMKFIRIDDGQRLQLNGNKGLIKIPSLNAGDIIEVRFASAGGSAGDRSLQASANCSLSTGEGTNVSNINTDFKTPQFTVTANGDAVLTNPENGLNFFYIKVYRVVPVVELSIGSTGWATFCSDKALDFSDVDGLTAYAVSAIKTGSVTISEVGEVPAGEGLILHGTANTTYNVPVIASTSAITNELLGAISDVAIQSGYTYYVLGADNESAAGVGLLRYTSSEDIPAGKAYLKITGEYATGAPSIFRIVEGENNATAVENIQSAEEVVKFIENGQLLIKKNGFVYDALGRVVR